MIHHGRMIRGRQNVNAGAHKRVLKRKDVSWHGTFHCRLEGQQIKAARGGEGGRPKWGRGVSTDARDATTMQFNVAFV